MGKPEVQPEIQEGLLRSFFKEHELACILSACALAALGTIGSLKWVVNKTNGDIQEVVGCVGERADSNGISSLQELIRTGLSECAKWDPAINSSAIDEIINNNYDEFVGCVEIALRKALKTSGDGRVDEATVSAEICLPKDIPEDKKQSLLKVANQEIVNRVIVELERRGWDTEGLKKQLGDEGLKAVVILALLSMI